MVVPSGKEKSYSFTLPKNILMSLSVLLAVFTFIIGVFSYDYFKVIREVYKNQYLKVENTQLKEQVQSLQIKMNSIIDDIDRIQKFETKIKVMTGADAMNEKSLQKPYPDQSSNGVNFLKENQIKTSEQFNEFKNKVLEKLSVPLLGFYAHGAETFTSEINKNSINKIVDKIASLDLKIDTSARMINQLEESLHEIDIALLNRKAFLNSTPSIKPTDGWVTSHFGPRKSHYAKRIKMHEGIDIGARSGTPIVSTADGLVVFSGKKPGFGNFIKIRHGFGIETIYAHAKKLFVKAGRKVQRGDLIAAVGSTGYSTGPHVHYEVRVNQVPVDPLYYILN
jgi:murein DD-endopeptidase MepM/ murein hydrolase activator NlpD